jgi:isoleucyl-tRNA synthetase
MVRVFAPFTPFLTEHMYQGLKNLVDWSKDDQTKSDKERASVHYLVIPKPREDLINEGIERSVDGMQKVVELGRVIRDRETMPLKYPLPELVLIHKDQKCLDDVHTLQGYVLDELNIKKLTLSRDKEKYGVKLRAEPDHKTLGARLKGEFKKVTKEIKGLSDKQVSEFVRDGSIDVLGNKLGPEDLRIMYTFEGNAEKYKAHSDQDILVLVDCTPDQSMMDEGIAREVVNRVQKLRKKAKLQPKDDVCVQYTLTPSDHDLGRIIKEHQEYIESTTKNVMTFNILQNKRIMLDFRFSFH